MTFGANIVCFPEAEPKRLKVVFLPSNQNVTLSYKPWTWQK